MQFNSEVFLDIVYSINIDVFIDSNRNRAFSLITNK
jgi:hypothetical protein